MHDPQHTFLSFVASGRSTSRLSDLLATGAYPLDVEALALHVNADYPPRITQTPYVGIDCRLHEPSADLEELDGNGPASSPSEAALALRTKLSRVIDRCIGPARRVGVMAGGGLDSAGLLALAVDWARRTGGSVFAIALDFEGPGDDRPHLRALEEKLGCEVLRMRPEEAAHRVPELMPGVDGAPSCWPTAPWEVELLARARAYGAEIVLSGAGGDDLFDGHPHALATLARRGKVLEAVRTARTLRGFSWYAPRFPVASSVFRPMLVAQVPAWLRLRRSRRGPLPVPSWAGPRLRRAAEESRARALSAFAKELRSGARPPDGTAPECSPDRRVSLAWSRHQEKLLTGLVQREPFMDYGLIAFMRSLPPEWLIFRGIRRGLFREAFRGLLPESVRMREDKALFGNAFRRLVGGPPGLARYRDLSRKTELAALGLVDADAFAAAFDAFAEAPGDGDLMATWSFVCMEAFLRSKVGRASC